MKLSILIRSRFFLVLVIIALQFLISILLVTVIDVYNSRVGVLRSYSANSELPDEDEDWYVSNHTLAVIVPFRDRFEEMLIFVPYLHKFLKRQKVRHKLFVVNQVDQYRFNRASLINIGYLHARETCDYMAMHDVDLLPLNANLSYRHPGPGSLFHVASPHYHPRYHYNKFVGGILIVTMEDFGRVNGMSNNYWGWGLEDDEFYTRIASAKLSIHRPVNLTTNTSNTFRHVHDRRVRVRDMEHCYNQKQVTRRRDRVTGVDSVQYSLLKLNQLMIDGAGVSVLNVRLHCDQTRTPWCDCNRGGTSNVTSTHSTGKAADNVTITHSTGKATGNVTITHSAGKAAGNVTSRDVGAKLSSTSGYRGGVSVEGGGYPRS